MEIQISLLHSVQGLNQVDRYQEGYIDFRFGWKILSRVIKKSDLEEKAIK